MSSLTPDISYIYRRKSHRSFSDRNLTQSETELALVAFNASSPLINDIRVAARLVKKEETSVSRGEYCLLIYSEKKPLYLENIGYILASTDLILQQNGIGSCFLGMGRTRHKEHEGLPFATMLNIGALKEGSLRNSVSDFTRNDPSGKLSALPDDVALQCSLAPSACNSQCWETEKSEDGVRIIRGEGNPSIMRGGIKTFFNRIDMGIFLWYLSASLSHNGHTFTLKLTGSDGAIHT
ncbi:MAG: nitroreductase family protein, partial [Bullifex sp.]